MNDFYERLYRTEILFSPNRGILYGRTNCCQLITYLRYIPHKTDWIWKSRSWVGKGPFAILFFLEPTAEKNSKGMWRARDTIGKVIFQSEDRCSDVWCREEIYRGLLKPQLEEILR